MFSSPSTICNRLWTLVRRCAGWGNACRNLHESEEGTMAQVTVIAVMGFTILVGMVGNVGRIVQKKVAVQNAADSVAYSTALWQARSMNAVTAVNHMLGEVTAICVLHEALGGPELDDGIPKDSEEFKDLNDSITDLKHEPDAIAIALVQVPQLRQLDRQIIELVQKVMTMDKGKTFSGATLYDSRITLKQLVAFLQDVKLAGNALIVAGEVFPVVAFLIPIGVGMHAIATPLMIKCGIEMGMLLVVETGAKIFSFPKKTVIEGNFGLLSMLAKYSEDLARPGSIASGPLATSIEKTVRELESRHAVQANVYPSPKQITLPLVAETGPKTGFGGLPRSRSVSADWPLGLDKILGLIATADDIVSFFNSVTDWIPGAKEITGWFKPNSPPPNNDGAPKNFTRDTLKNLNADWNNEESTQWVRATYPWVDSLRAPLIRGMKNPAVLQLSKAGVWYGHWTNRLTLAKSFSYRSGRSLSKTGSMPKLKMYVMKEMQPTRKGRENWTTDSDAAERLFTNLGFATHRVEALFSPVVFGGASHEQIVYAQAMYYNANPQEPGNRGSVQPNVGWDTLNWTPPVNVPEYGTVPTERGSMWPPWAMFQRTTHSNTPGIKLNWQAKLVPVTRRRLAQSATGGSYKGNIRESIGKALINTRQL
ncbi:MAG: Tad domain-containing protein, partial [Planctomycetaceae bacterium]|nr:Tad domain-containing protein [Planctomycetaceae bacterium]